MKDYTEPIVPAIMDGSQERPIPTAWRSTFRDVINCIAAGNREILNANTAIIKVTTEDWSRFQDNIQAYGATLAPLSEETWKTSSCIWYGTYWGALIDLWTREEGRSDLVLDARITPIVTGILIEIHLIYVP